MMLRRRSPSHSSALVRHGNFIIGAITDCDEAFLASSPPPPPATVKSVVSEADNEEHQAEINNNIMK